MINMQQIVALVEAAEESHGGVIGIRALHEDETPAIGDIMPESAVWTDDVRTAKKLGGTAAFYPTEIGIKTALSYFGANTRFAILSGDMDMGSCGMPERHAFILRDAEVVAVTE